MKDKIYYTKDQVMTICTAVLSAMVAAKVIDQGLMEGMLKIILKSLDEIDDAVTHKEL